MGLPFGCTSERERERVDFFANIFSVWHPDRLSLESNQDAKIFRAKKSTVCKERKAGTVSSRLRSDSAAKQQAVNVIGSLHHMSQWSWVFMHRRWIRIIRLLAVTWVGFLSNSSCVKRSENMWRECCFFFFFSSRGDVFLHFLSPQSASEQGFQFPAVHKRGIGILDDLSEWEAQSWTLTQSHFPWMSNKCNRNQLRSISDVYTVAWKWKIKSCVAIFKKHNQIKTRRDLVQLRRYLMRKKSFIYGRVWLTTCSHGNRKAEPSPPQRCDHMWRQWYHIFDKVTERQWTHIQMHVEMFILKITESEI